MDVNLVEWLEDMYYCLGRFYLKAYFGIVFRLVH